jgi:hypothetical protein
MGDIVMQRGFKPWMQSDFLFHLSPMAKVQKKCLTILHNMTNSVIQTRKRQFLQSRKDSLEKKDNADIGEHTVHIIRYTHRKSENKNCFPHGS